MRRAGEGVVSGVGAKLGWCILTITSIATEEGSGLFLESAAFSRGGAYILYSTFATLLGRYKGSCCQMSFTCLTLMYSYIGMYAFILQWLF